MLTNPMAADDLMGDFETLFDCLSCSGAICGEGCRRAQLRHARAADPRTVPFPPAHEDADQGSAPPYPASIAL